MAAADILLVQLENNLSAIQRMIDNARAGGTFVILNPAPWQKVSDALLAGGSVNAQQHRSDAAERDKGDRFCQRARRRSAEPQGARQVIITLGTAGALLSSAEQQLRIPLFPAQPLDTTGAGDAFNGALAARRRPAMRYRRRRCLRRRLPRCVERSGAANSMPSYAEALARMQAIRSVK